MFYCDGCGVTQDFMLKLRRRFTTADCSCNHTGPLKTHIHFCPSCDKTWEHSNEGCSQPTPGVRCPNCETVSDRAPYRVGSVIKRGAWRTA